ncbi:hypothetical protein EV175_000730 [Coemansia sp. RSA 1933]|nr:hypothetical protein EV175_000730 [Coemansia sp. RSA 1933]
MFLGDMWRYSGIVQPVDSHGRLIIDNTLGLDQMELMRRSDNTSSWQPSEHHYNVVLDVINRDPSSKIDEMLLLHRDMKARAQRDEDSEDCGIKPTVQLWCTIISAYADRNMIPQMLAARRVMSGLGVRPSVYAFGPIFAAFHKERQIMVRKGKDATHVMKQALREYKVMRDEGVEPNEVILTNLMLTIGYSRQDMDSKSTYSSDKDADRSDHQKKLVDVFRLISQKLESILVQSHNPQIYAALIGIAGRARRLDEEIWNLVLPTRQQVWARREFHGDHVGGDDMLEGELPVVTNDVSSQLIRIAARASNVQFGEQVFAAFESEISCFGTRRSRDPAEGVDDTQPDNRRRFPSHMQCDPNVHTYTSMVTLYANNTDIHGVGKMWNLMLRDGVEPNLHTYTSLVVALHRHALRERWRRLREHKRCSVAEDGHKAAGSDSRGKDTQPWASTKHDAMIDNIEEWLVNKNDDAKENIRKHSSDYSVADEAGSSSGEDSPSLDWFKEIASLDIDIPLSTLLLRYRAVRIREAMGKTHFNGHAKRRDYEQDEAIKQIQRAMELCQKVESAGLQPDFKFQTALADLFDACGDKPGAELVRRRIEEVYKRRSSR